MAVADQLHTPRHVHASLRAAGWRVVAERRARAGWSMPSRVRHLLGTENVQRTLWEAS